MRGGAIINSRKYIDMVVNFESSEKRSVCCLSAIRHISFLNTVSKSFCTKKGRFHWQCYVNKTQFGRGVFASSHYVGLLVAIDTEWYKCIYNAFISKIKADLLAIKEPIRKDILVAAKQILRITRNENCLIR